MLNEESLKELIEMVMEELGSSDSGTTYEFKSDDPDLQTKTNKLTSDSTLFDKSKDKIEVKTENVHKIADIKRMVMERKYHGKAYKKSELIEMITKKEYVCECGGEIKEDSKDFIKKNVIKINLTLSDQGLQKFKKIPTFNELLYPNQINSLKVGENILTVNNYIFGKLQRVSGYDGSGNISVSKIENNETIEEENNPWAICSANIDKSKNPEKHERCVKNVKKQNNIKK